MVVNRYMNGVYLKEEDVSKIVIRIPAVIEIFERVINRVNSEYAAQQEVSTKIIQKSGS